MSTMSAMSEMSEHRLPSFEETVVIEALFLEKQELFLERKRLIEAVSELANLRQEMKEMEVKMRQEMEMEAKMRQEVELEKEKEVLKKELEKSLATMCMLRRKEKEVLKEALKKELEEDEKDYEKIEVNIKGGGNRGNIERYNNFNISFNISLPEITLHQKEMELCLILHNSNASSRIDICDQYYYPKLGSSHTNTSGYSSPMIVSERCGKSYGFTSNEYGKDKSQYSNIWIQLVRNSDIGILLSQQGNNPSKWEKIIKTLVQKISDEMDKIFKNLSDSFRYMEKIF